MLGYEKIVQIIPPPVGLFAEYKDNGVYRSAILLFGLTEDGNILCFDMDSDGIVQPPTEASNFIRFINETSYHVKKT